MLLCSVRDQKHGSCWWKPPHVETCEEFYRATHPDWTAGHWTSLNSSPGSAVPLAESTLGVPLDETYDSDTADKTRKLSSSVMRERPEVGVPHKWKRFYTQEIGDLVYELYQADFESFGYPREFFVG